MAGFVFSSAKLDIANDVINLSSDSFEAHLVITTPSQSSDSTVSDLVLSAPSGSSGSSNPQSAGGKTITQVGSQVRFSFSNITFDSYDAPNPVVGVVIAKDSGELLAYNPFNAPYTANGRDLTVSISPNGYVQIQ
jgi:hypothetical protein